MLLHVWNGVLQEIRHDEGPHMLFLLCMFYHFTKELGVLQMHIRLEDHGCFNWTEIWQCAHDDVCLSCLLFPCQPLPTSWSFLEVRLTSYPPHLCPKPLLFGTHSISLLSVFSQDIPGFLLAIPCLLPKAHLLSLLHQTCGNTLNSGFSLPLIS